MRCVARPATRRATFCGGICGKTAQSFRRRPVSDRCRRCFLSRRSKRMRSAHRRARTTRRPLLPFSAQSVTTRGGASESPDVAATSTRQTQQPDGHGTDDSQRRRGVWPAFGHRESAESDSSLISWSSTFTSGRAETVDPGPSGGTAESASPVHAAGRQIAWAVSAARGRPRPAFGGRLRPRTPDAGHHLVEHRAKAEDVAAGIDLPAGGLLRRHVRGGPAIVPGTLRATSPVCVSRLLVRSRPANQLGQAEVEHLHGAIRRRPSRWPA